ncbi:MAG: hypothetical protein O7E52_28895 [Candidatus Poribacteria bacterium]|nr:hypothetical protein [Candidatus Poribacteria bacterium]
MEQERRDLIVVTADSQQKQTVSTLLLERWQSLGIRQLAINAASVLSCNNGFRRKNKRTRERVLNEN